MNWKRTATALGLTLLWMIGFYWIIVAATHMSTWNLNVGAVFGVVASLVWSFACLFVILEEVRL